MKYFLIQTTKLKENCIIIWCSQTKNAAIVDPGGNFQSIIQFIALKKLIVKKILLTHGHIDHVYESVNLSKYYNVKIFGPQKKDEFLFENLDQQSKIFNFPYCNPFIPSYWLEDGISIFIGKILLQVYHCPGHTPGHIVFFNKKTKLLISGDILFRGSIGSTSFPGSNLKDLMYSICIKIFNLGDEVIFIPGHGEISNIKEEKLNNPFIYKNL